eukprot:5077734-Prymnesium_polylepis.2
MGDYCGQTKVSATDLTMLPDGDMHRLQDVLERRGAEPSDRPSDAAFDAERGSPRSPRHPAPFKTPTDDPNMGKGMPTFRIPYRSVLLDRTLVQAGVFPVPNTAPSP